MSGGGFFIIILAFAFLWLVIIRPQKKRQLESQRLQSSIEVGSEVLTAGGIYGQITAVDGDDLVVLVAPGVEVRVAKRAIGAVVPPAEPDESAEPAASAPETDG